MVASADRNHVGYMNMTTSMMQPVEWNHSEKLQFAPCEQTTLLRHQSRLRGGFTAALAETTQVDLCIHGSLSSFIQRHLFYLDYSFQYLLND